LIVSGENGKTHVIAFFGTEQIEQALAFFFVEFKFFPEHVYVGHFEVVDGELLLVGKADVGIFEAGGPFDVVHAVDVLQEGDDAFEAVSDFGGD